MSLVARFTGTGLALTIIVGGFLAFIVGRSIERTAMEHEAWGVSETVTQTLGPAIAASDFDVSGDVSDHAARVDEIAQAQDALTGDSRIRELRIWAADGTLVFSPDLEMVGLRFQRHPLLDRSLYGEIASTPVLVHGRAAEKLDAGMQTFAPIRARDGSILGAYEIQHSTMDISERIQEEQRILWMSVAAGLLVLYTGLFGIVKRASSDLEWHHREVAARGSPRGVDRMKAEFASTVSHELRAPLTSLIGYSELLLARGSKHGKEREWAESIHRQSERLSALLDDVLSASMIEDSAVVVTPRALDLAGVVSRTITGLPCLSPNIAIETHLPPDLPPILADCERLQQILTNLLSNAVKYSPDGGEIRVSAAVVNGRLRLSVIDRGLGISQHALPRLFERFHRVHARSNPDIHGTGLGLYISRRLAELQGGNLWAESRGPGMGSTFHLELPLASTSEGHYASVTRPRLAVGASR